MAEEARLKESQELSKLLMINQRVLRHNIRNELSIALGYLENLETVDDVEEIPETNQIIRRHLNELLGTTERTREIVTIWENDGLHTVDLTEIVKTQLGQFREEYPEITITTELPEQCEVQAHPSLSLAIEEAVLNAIDHNSADVRITISVNTQNDETVIVEISDTGKGISAVDREAMEIPTETPLTHTEGLGMWIIYWTLIMSGGRVEFAENEPQGAIVRLILPQSSSFFSIFSRNKRDK
ncbi:MULTISPECIES: HAMP domain-containing sensor histidine kinase [unclassified Haloferax]|uniref:sensor histidine kinase n=1 Tax=unclassified Haloferax TaxID=2625095 RepID=UPI00287B6C49|nr:MULTISPECIES: HAMP domain-containing sensor histidine kinase [unclassified Haloferax]